MSELAVAVLSSSAICLRPTSSSAIMAQTTRHFHQNFFDEDIEPITATTVKLSHLTEDLLKPFLDNPCDPIGIAPAYAQSDNQLVVLAISNASQVLLVELFSKSGAERGTFVPSQRKNSPGHTLLQDKLLYRPMGNIYAFDFEPLALSLYKDHGGLRLVNGVDMQSACCPEDRDRQPLMSIKAAIGDDTTIYDDNIRDSFENMIYDPKRTPEIANRAWVSQYLARLGTMEAVFAAAKKIDTQKIPGVVSLLGYSHRAWTQPLSTLKTLDLLAKTSRDGQRLDREKPTQTRKNVVAHWDAQKGQMVAKVDRYQNKMRTSLQQVCNAMANLPRQSHAHTLFSEFASMSAMIRGQDTLYRPPFPLLPGSRRMSKCLGWRAATS